MAITSSEKLNVLKNVLPKNPDKSIPNRKKIEKESPEVLKRPDRKMFNSASDYMRANEKFNKSGNWATEGKGAPRESVIKNFNSTLIPLGDPKSNSFISPLSKPRTGGKVLKIRGIT